jgi:hypothetical protein
MVVMILYMLKTMTWYLKTAFGQSKILFGGRALDPSIGLGQGNGAAPPRGRIEFFGQFFFNIFHFLWLQSVDI